MPAPSSYKQEYADQARKFCLLGADDKQLAEFFSVSEVTINAWKKRYPEFLKSLKDGKAIADANVGQSLYEKATGYEWDEQQPIKLKQVEYKDGKRVREVERVEIFPVHRVIPPDTTAIIFWLKNRRKDNWRDKQDHELTGKDGGAVEQNMTITYMPEPLDENYFRKPTDNSGQ